MVSCNNVTNNKYSDRKVAENPNYEYWRRVEQAERLNKQFEKEHNMCCFSIVISILVCFCFPCLYYKKTYPEKI